MSKNTEITSISMPVYVRDLIEEVARVMSQEARSNVGRSGAISRMAMIVGRQYALKEKVPGPLTEAYRKAKLVAPSEY